MAQVGGASILVDTPYEILVNLRAGERVHAIVCWRHVSEEELPGGAPSIAGTASSAGPASAARAASAGADDVEAPASIVGAEEAGTQASSMQLNPAPQLLSDAQRGKHNAALGFSG